MKKFETFSDDEMLNYIKDGTDDRIYAIAELLRRKTDIGMICNATKIDMLFLEKIKNIVKTENKLKEHIGDTDTLYTAKKLGFSDEFIGKLWGMTGEEIYKIREKRGMFPVYKMIDTCASEFESYIPYFYSTIRIGQGV